MPLLVVFVTAQVAVIDTVKKRKTALIPDNMRENGFSALGVRDVVLSVYKVTDRSTPDGVLAHINALDLQTASGVIILTDNSLAGLADHFGDIFSVNCFRKLSFRHDLANSLTATLAKCLSTFRYYKRRFNDSKYHQVLRLPLEGVMYICEAWF